MDHLCTKGEAVISEGIKCGCKCGSDSDIISRTTPFLPSISKLILVKWLPYYLRRRRPGRERLPRRVRVDATNSLSFTHRR